MTFQHTAARRRLVQVAKRAIEMSVSTHSRPKAAGSNIISGLWNGLFQHTAARRRLWCRAVGYAFAVCFNTQPPEGGCSSVNSCTARSMRFNTQPPEGGCGAFLLPSAPNSVSTHSRPKAAGITGGARFFKLLFQHTAARRRLFWLCQHEGVHGVSTHSRPKAADPHGYQAAAALAFQHTAARRRLITEELNNPQWAVSTHSRPKAAEPPYRPA